MFAGKQQQVDQSAESEVEGVSEEDMGTTCDGNTDSHEEMEMHNAGK